MLKILKELAYVFVFCLLSLSCTTLQVHCLKEAENDNIQTLSDINLWQIILGDNAKAIGFLYNGGNELDYMNYIFPTINIYIKRDNQQIDLTTADLRLVKYKYNLETKTAGEEQGEIRKSDKGNFFEIEFDNLETPYAYHYKLAEYDTENNRTLYEFDAGVVGYNTAGTAQSVDIYLNITSEEEANKGFFEKIIDMLEELVNFVTGFFDYLMGNLKDALEIIFIPSDEFLEEWAENIQTQIEEKLPIVSIPFTILRDILQRNEWEIRNAGIRWESLVYMEKEIIPAGSFDFANFAEKNKAINELREYGLLFTDFILCMLLIKYLRRKISLIFGKD